MARLKKHKPYRFYVFIQLRFLGLFIRTADKDGLFEKKIRFLAKLKRQIGEQKIDVVFNEDEDRLIEQEVRKWSIPL